VLLVTRLKVLLSAYACEPGAGSEPGVGWNLARYLAEHHEVWVLTRANNRELIEAELARNPIRGLHFVYHDLPSWARSWKRGQRGVQLYYYLWQLTAIPLVRRLHREVRFDVAQHATFVKYWAPSALAFLRGVPFVWGPVGGGESAPLAFWPTFGLRGIVYEVGRTLARFLGEWDPLVRITARRASLGLAVTSETATRLKRLGVKRVEIMSQVALPVEELGLLSQVPLPPKEPVRFLSVGRLLHWKGFHLAIRAFAQSGVKEAEYWFVGEGPEQRRLEALARRLGVADRVRFLGKLPREKVLEVLAQVHALIHPSLHESGGWVVMESIAAGRPVICLDLGGPSMQVTESVGFKIAAQTPEQAVRDIAKAMRLLFGGLAQFQFAGVSQEFSWHRKVAKLSEFFVEMAKERHD